MIDRGASQYDTGPRRLSAVYLIRLFTMFHLLCLLLSLDYCKSHFEALPAAHTYQMFKSNFQIISGFKDSSMTTPVPQLEQTMV